jgi:hypothetical protein
MPVSMREPVWEIGEARYDNDTRRVSPSNLILSDPDETAGKLRRSELAARLIEERLREQCKYKEMVVRLSTTGSSRSGGMPIKIGLAALVLLGGIFGMTSILGAPRASNRPLAIARSPGVRASPSPVKAQAPFSSPPNDKAKPVDAARLDAPVCTNSQQSEEMVWLKKQIQEIRNLAEAGVGERQAWEARVKETDMARSKEKQDADARLTKEQLQKWVRQEVNASLAPLLAQIKQESSTRISSVSQLYQELHTAVSAIDGLQKDVRACTALLTSYKEQVAGMGLKHQLTQSATETSVNETARALVALNQSLAGLAKKLLDANLTLTSDGAALKDAVVAQGMRQEKLNASMLAYNSSVLSTLAQYQTMSAELMSLNASMPAQSTANETARELVRSVERLNEGLTGLTKQLVDANLTLTSDSAALKDAVVVLSLNASLLVLHVEHMTEAAQLLNATVAAIDVRLHKMNESVLALDVQSKKMKASMVLLERGEENKPTASIAQHLQHELNQSLSTLTMLSHMHHVTHQRELNHMSHMHQRELNETVLRLNHSISARICSIMPRFSVLDKQVGGLGFSGLGFTTVDKVYKRWQTMFAEDQRLANDVSRGWTSHRASDLSDMITDLSAPHV